MAALHSFFRYLQYRHPVQMYEWQRILSIPVKRTAKPTITYLSLEGITLLLAQPDQQTAKGRRDLALLSLMYDSAARVQEMIDLSPACVGFNKPYTVKLLGKGQKQRIVPLMVSQLSLLRNYMVANRLTEPYAASYPLFSNNRYEKLTRMGITLTEKVRKRSWYRSLTLSRKSDPTCPTTFKSNAPTSGRGQYCLHT